MLSVMILYVVFQRETRVMIDQYRAFSSREQSAAKMANWANYWLKLPIGLFLHAAVRCPRARCYRAMTSHQNYYWPQNDTCVLQWERWGHYIYIQWSTELPPHNKQAHTVTVLHDIHWFYFCRCLNCVDFRLFYLCDSIEPVFHWLQVQFTACNTWFVVN